MKGRSLIRAAALTVVWIAIVTISSELSSTFKRLLSTIGDHHWVGKSVLSIVFFAGFYLVLSRFDDGEFSLKDTWWLISAVVISGLAILVFYVIHA